MTGFLERILNRYSKYASKKLRLSQIKLLYQNQRAIEFLMQEFGNAPPIDRTFQSQMLDDLNMFQLYTDTSITELTYAEELSEADSKKILEINKALRNVYAGLMEGRKSARAQFGHDADGIVAFEKRFMPAAGWDNISDKEWDRMVAKALESARNAPPPF